MPRSPANKRPETSNLIWSLGSSYERLVHPVPAKKGTDGTSSQVATSRFEVPHAVGCEASRQGGGAGSDSLVPRGGSSVPSVQGGDPLKEGLT